MESKKSEKEDRSIQERNARLDRKKSSRSKGDGHGNGERRQERRNQHGSRKGRRWIYGGDLRRSRKSLGFSLLEERRNASGYFIEKRGGGERTAINEEERRTNAVRVETDGQRSRWLSSLYRERSQVLWEIIEERKEEKEL